MSDQNNRGRDSVERRAESLTDMLDSGRQTTEVANALREDSYNMSPRDFSRMVSLMQNNERTKVGDDIYKDRTGNVVLDTGNQQVVVATRDWDVQNQSARNGDNRDDRDSRGERNQRGRQGNGTRETIRDGIVNGAIGAAIGGVMEGKKGLLIGGIAGASGTVVDKVGENNRDTITDIAVKGGIGAGIGAIIGDSRGAGVGAAAGTGAAILDKVLKRRERE